MKEIDLVKDIIKFYLENFEKIDNLVNRNIRKKDIIKLLYKKYRETKLNEIEISIKDIDNFKINKN